MSYRLNVVLTDKEELDLRALCEIEGRSKSNLIKFLIKDRKRLYRIEIEQLDSSISIQDPKNTVDVPYND